MNVRRATCLIGVSSMVLGSLLTSTLQAGTVTIVDDSFTDLNRAKTGALDADWWSSSASSGNSVEIDATGLGLISGTSGRGIHATFSPQTLAIGDTITVTYRFTTPATVGTTTGSSVFKVALMDFNHPGLAADLEATSSSPQPRYFNLPGYMSSFDLGTGTEDVDFREHNVNTTGRFLGITGEWTSIGDSANVGYTFAANTDYVGVYSITRTGADSHSLFSSMSQGTTLMASHTDTDASGIANNFGMFGLWANSGIFGSNTTAGNADNGITLTNFKVEVTTPEVPEPSALALLIGVLISLPQWVRKR